MKLSLSPLLALLPVLIFAGCAAGKRTSSAQSEMHARVESEAIVQNFGAVETEGVRSYLAYLEQRLSLAAARIPNAEAAHYHFILVNSNDPLALSLGGYRVIISKGLVRALSNEAELAFVLAHELAHQKLGHAHLLEEESSRQNGELPAAEIEADRFAVGLIALAGYDPRSGAGALVHAYRANGLAENRSTHPALESRLNAVLHAVLESKWQPPGTIDRRAFRMLQRDLSTSG
ncbi:MAG: M48 family metallopeptidase [Oligoflexia bacterium]|nr:M48 family metallopeptidase [Oligoflexia bacterium]